MLTLPIEVEGITGEILMTRSIERAPEAALARMA
jgi:hypothetical protein